MENRFQRIFLTPFIIASTLLLAALSCSYSANAAEQDNDSQIQVKADVERRQIFDDLLDSENFEVGIQGGIISIEDFESIKTKINKHYIENTTFTDKKSMTQNECSRIIKTKRSNFK